MSITASVAQTSFIDYKKLHGPQLGISANKLQDASLSKVLHQGPGFYFGTFTEKSTGLSFQRIEVSLAANFLKSNYEIENSSFHFQLPFKYTYLRSLRKLEKGPAIYFGGFASFAANIEYFDNWDQNHFYWLTSYNLGVDFRTELHLSSKGKLQVESNIPIISLISRPPEQITNTQASSSFFNILKTIHTNPTIAFPIQHLSFCFGVRYIFFNKRKIQPALVWKLQYLKNNTRESRSLKIMNQTIGIEFYF